METDFSNVIFPNEFRANLDGPCAWAYNWVSHDRVFSKDKHHASPRWWKCDFLTEIVGSTILWQIQVNKGIKQNAQRYCQLLHNKLSISWLDKAE